MIREVIKPQDSSFVIDIPNNYIDKEVEFIMFLLDESESVHKVKQQDIALLGGSLKKYANPSKIDLEDKAWELHIEDISKCNP